MKKVYFTPGPSELYFTYEDHLRYALSNNIGSISHRSKSFESIFEFTVEQLTELLKLPEGYQVVFSTSATECWERISQNLITNESDHLVHGAFGEKFYKTALDQGKTATIHKIDEDFAASSMNSHFIALTMNETSTGFQHSQHDLKEIRKLNPNALIALDVVSATPSIEVGFEYVDTAYFSVQKCFGLPPGLGVWIVNEKSIEVANKIGYKSYHSLPSLLKFSAKNQTPSTPNMLGIYLLGKIVEDMNRRGIEMIRNETNYKAALLYQTLDHHDQFAPSISNKSHRSKTTIVADCKSNAHVLDFLNSQGMVIGTGYGGNSDNQIRIANFPTHSKEQIELLCDSLVKFT